MTKEINWLAQMVHKSICPFFLKRKEGISSSPIQLYKKSLIGIKKLHFCYLCNVFLGSFDGSRDSSFPLHFSFLGWKDFFSPQTQKHFLKVQGN